MNVIDKRYGTQGLLKVPIKYWTDKLDNNTLAQAENLTDLPFAFRHIALMPDTHMGYGMPIGGVLATKGVVIPNAVGVDIGCFTGDTKIVTLNGNKTLKELYDEKVENFQVFSIDENGDYVIATADRVKLTRKNASLIKLTLDNGETITCTPDHKFLTKKLDYIEAKDISHNMSLYPFIKKDDGHGYDTLCYGGTRQFISVHKLAAMCGYVSGYVQGETHIHHIDGNKKNNSISNLKAVNVHKHLSEHAKNNCIFHTDEFKKAKEETIKNRGYYYDPSLYERKAQVGRNNIINYMDNNRDHFLESVKDNGKRGGKVFKNINNDPEFKRISKINRLKKIVEYCYKEYGEINKRTYDLSRDMFYNAYTYSKALEILDESNLTFELILEGVFKFNHKVINIEVLDHVEDVYCITVPTYHNFALSCGVVVHNCGMRACNTGIKVPERPVLENIVKDIRRDVPTGPSRHKKPRDGNLMPYINNIAVEDLYVCNIEYESALCQLGTLGGGNHFIELQKDKDNNLWVMIHSGSRNIGKQVADWYNRLARDLNKTWFSKVEDSWRLAFLPIDHKYGHDYINEMTYCTYFAMANRREIMDAVLQNIAKHTKKTINWNSDDVPHNYARMEHHFRTNVMVHRKGATSAKKGELGIIPGSQGTKSYIVEGLGNPESFMSCSHGAGRCKGRKQAIRELDLNATIKKLDDVGVIHNVSKQKHLDEAPGAYKDINKVINNQKDLVKVVTELTPVAVVKG